MRGSIVTSRPTAGTAIALVALFVALSGTAVALPGKNRIDKNDYQRGSIGTRAIANNSIRGSDVRNNSLTESDILESSLGQVPSAVSADTAKPVGPAGGDLTGNYPNPTVGPNAVSGAEVTDDSVTGTDVKESTLSGVNATTVGGRAPSAFLSSSVYKIDSPLGTGTALGDGTNVKNQACNPGDALLSGGPANISAGTDLLESFSPGTGTNSWSARINDNGVTDNFSVVVLCVDQ